MAKTKLIHLGSFTTDFENKISKDFSYVSVEREGNKGELYINGQPIIDDNELNNKFRSGLFLITDQLFLEDSYWLILKRLPANSILIDNHLVLSEGANEALKLKNPQFINFSNLQDLATQIKKYFFTGQLGYKLNIDKVQFSPTFSGAVSQIGHNWFEVRDSGEKEYQKVMSWHAPLGIAPDTEWDVTLEHELLSDETDIMLRIILVSPQSEQVYLVKDVELKDLDEATRVEVQPQGGYLIAEIFAKGSSIDFKIGQIHVRHSRDGRGEMLIGEKEVVDKSQLNSSVLYHFDSGDFKPPLNVYFSGFRTAEGIEGGVMMQNLKSPSLKFADPRLLGGAFYVGSEKIQTEIIKIITETLQKLNFKPNELILSGLSMGTYAALYYSSFLDPAWVIIGKPLTNLGTIAANERINRPGGFPTSLDMVLRFTGGIGPKNIRDANNMFWDTFKLHKHTNTNFVIAYMEDDDYDPKAFSELTEYLHQNIPDARIIHKGLVGRHNDATGELVQWYLQQYRNILEVEYGKTFNE